MTEVAYVPLCSGCMSTAVTVLEHVEYDTQGHPQSTDGESFGSHCSACDTEHVGSAWVRWIRVSSLFAWAFGQRPDDVSLRMLVEEIDNPPQLHYPR